MKDIESPLSCAVLYNIFLKIIMFLCPLQKMSYLIKKYIKCFAAEIGRSKNEDQVKKMQAKLKSNTF